MSKKILLPVTILVVGVLAIVALVFAKPKPVPRELPDEPALVQVAVTQAQQESLRLSVNAQGTVMPKREIELVAQVSGLISSVEPAFVDGGFFGAGQVLVRIDEREYQAALLSAKSRLADAAQRLAEEEGRSLQAAREWRDLGNQNANDLFMRKPQLASAQANLEANQGAVAIAGLNLERTQISAPFKGRVRETHVNLGQYVSAGTALAKVYDSTVVEVRLPLTEQQAALIDLPLTAGLVSDSNDRPKVTLTGTVAGEQHTWSGTLTRTDAFVDANSRMYYAVVEVVDPFAIDASEGDRKMPLLPGLFVQAEIEGKRLDNVVKLPRTALFERDKLLTLDGEHKIAEQKVRVLRRTEDEVWIRADLSENMLISLEKQSLTPVGTVVDPILPQAEPHVAPAESVAQVQAQTQTQVQGKD